MNEPEILDDGTRCAITINRLLAHRSIKFDETELRLGSDKDNSGSRSRTHTNPNLNRSGSRHTRSSGHVTGGIAVNGAGELLPPLIIFSSNAEKEENLAFVKSLRILDQHLAQYFRINWSIFELFI